MFEILEKELIGPKEYKMVVRAPRVAAKALPGQFLIVRADAEGERIPLTVCDDDKEAGTVTIVFQTVGAETYRMSELAVGEAFADVVGPLGNPSDLVDRPIEELQKMKIIFIAGGVGTAPVYHQLKWLHEHGVDADCIQGARNKDLLIMINEMRAVCGNLYLATDDGSEGFHGNGSQCLAKLYEDGKRYDHCVIIGPMIMMKFTAMQCEKLGLFCVVSMNTVMVDGTGMCGACRLLVGGEVKFACVDGPEFDGSKVDYDQAMLRGRLYKTEEGRLLLKEQEGATHEGGCGVCK
jgi:ferredoxin--NADP+ reductase